jgi:P27 family predicted phage terminase small subunit
MQGRKPKSSNVIPLTGGAPRLSPAALARKLCPRGLPKDERREFLRVAMLLAEPALDRLKPQYTDAILEYCRAALRLRAFRQFFLSNGASIEERGENIDGGMKAMVERFAGTPGLDAEVYVVRGRNGIQIKSHPFVAQLNETWRQWRSLMMELGLSPASERNLQPGQGDLFSDPASKYLSGA